MSVLERVREVESVRSPESAPASSVQLRQARELLRSELVGRLGLATIASMLSEEGASEVRSELRVVLEAILNTREDVCRAADRETLLRQVIDEVCGLGPIQPLLEDSEITEVMINGVGALFYERGGELHPAEAVFDSPEQIMIVMDRILAPLGRRLDRSSPLVSARLANGDRVNAVAAPIAIDGPAVTIRKFSDRIRTLARLVEVGSIPAWYARLLSWAVRSARSIAVAGGTGSGKTTLLNALSCEIPTGERIVTIEDSAELRFDAHPNVVRLEARDSSIEGSGEVTIRDLVKNALRMRPDRIVVGEVRAGEPTDLIEEQIATAIDLIVVTRRLSDGTRVVTSLTEVSRAEDGSARLDERVSYNSGARSWELWEEPSFVEKALEDGILSEEEVEEWRAR